MVNDLLSYFPYISNGLKDYQEKIWNAIISNNENFLYVLPTGAGKTLLYQLYPLYTNEWGLVVSPLISLIKDQVSNTNFPSKAIHSEVKTKEEKIEILKSASKGKYKLLYISPERLTSIPLQAILENSDIPPKFIIVDEVHCLSEWGRDFRLNYLRIKELAERLKLRLICCTATLSDKAKNEILKELNIPEKNFFSPIPPNRNNLKCIIEPTKNKQDSLESFEKKLPELIKLGQGLVFVISPNTARQLSEKYKQYFNTDWYGGIDSKEEDGKRRTVKERNRVQNDWINGKIQILFCTSAFGMGIDKSNIRWIVHIELPSSLEAYWQQIGRAGRDGMNSICYVLSSNQEFKFHKSSLSKKFGNLEKITELMDFMTDENEITISLGNSKNPKSDLETRQLLSWIFTKHNIYFPLFEYIPSIKFEVLNKNGVDILGVFFGTGRHEYKLKSFYDQKRISDFVVKLFFLNYSGELNVDSNEVEFIELRFLVDKKEYYRNKNIVLQEIKDLYLHKKTRIEIIQSWNCENNIDPKGEIYKHLI